MTTMVDSGLREITGPPIVDADGIEFLQWALPRLGMRWRGFRKVRRQVYKRIRRRLGELGLPDLKSYRGYLERDADEWRLLDGFCRISISRFYRDRDVFDHVRDRVLPALARQVRKRGGRVVRCWSAGCASGEEPYTLGIIWKLHVRPQFPEVSIEIVATDTQQYLLDRARHATYGLSSLKDLPADWVARAFVWQNGEYQLQPAFREGVQLLQQDLRETSPEDAFDLVLCRHLAFTYFDLAGQQAAVDRLTSHLAAGGFLVVAKKETLPDPCPGVALDDPHLGIYRKTDKR